VDSGGVLYVVEAVLSDPRGSRLRKGSNFPFTDDELLWNASGLALRFESWL